MNTLITILIASIIFYPLLIFYGVTHDNINGDNKFKLFYSMRPGDIIRITKCERTDQIPSGIYCVESIGLFTVNLIPSSQSPYIPQLGVLKINVMDYLLSKYDFYFI